MANSISTSAIMVTQETLRTLLIRYPVLKTLAHQFDAIPGTGVKVPTISSTTAGSWATNKSYTPIDRTAAAITINPGDWDIKYHSFSLNPLEQAVVNPQIVARLSESGAHAVGKAILDGLVGLCTVANVPAGQEIVATTVDLSALIAADAALAGRGVVDPKFAIMNGTSFANLLSDDSIHSALVRGDSTDPLVSGRLGNVIGYPVDRYAGMSNNSEDLKGIIGGVDGFALVTGVPLEEESAAVQLAIVQEPNSGLTALLRQYVAQDSGTSVYTIAIGVASKLGTSASLQRITGTDHS